MKSPLSKVSSLPQAGTFSPARAVSRPIQARLDLAALRHNHRLARERAGGARLWTVVKADAYGHGLLRCAEALADEADGFALLGIEDAITLREAGIRQPILLLEGVFAESDLPLCAEYGLTPVVHRPGQLQMLRAAALPVRLPVWLKLNTGMNRLGLSGEELASLRADTSASSALTVQGLMTHFAEADGERGIALQLARFNEMRAGWSVPVSLANSAALLRYPEASADWVRPGIMLYGASPFADEDAASHGLRPVMTLSSRLIGVQQVAAGERVGYGGVFTADRPMRIGIVACGYADGYPRHASTGTPLLVEGRRTRTLGRVSMDMLACDLSELPEADVGSPVVLWGRGLPADEVAAAAGTISYELFCALARRVPVVLED